MGERVPAVDQPGAEVVPRDRDEKDQRDHGMEQDRDLRHLIERAEPDPQPAQGQEC